MDATYTGKQISEHRKALGLTQKELAEKLHVTDKAVSKWERGVNFPDLGLMETLAAALETTPAVLLGLENADQNEIVSSITQISNEQLEDAQKDMRRIGWGCLAAVLLLALVYRFIAHQRTQGYQLLMFLMLAAAIGGIYLLFKYGEIRKWNTGDWVVSYLAVFPIILFNAGYLFMDRGFHDGVELCFVMLSALGAQWLAYRVMRSQWAKALPVIGLTLYNLWHLANGGVSMDALLCSAVCLLVWLVLRRRDQAAKPVPFLKIAAVFLVGIILYGVLFYDSAVQAYVKLRHAHLESYCTSLLEENHVPYQTRYGFWTVYVYPEANMVEFHTGGGGFGSETSYQGFYYSSEDAHIPFQGSDAEMEANEALGTGWWHDGTDNHGTTTRFRKYFYWFEAYF